MTTTTFLGLTHLTTGQSAKEVTANEAFDEFDKAVSGFWDYNFASDINLTIGETSSRYHKWRLTDTGAVLTGDKTLTMYNRKFDWIIDNQTDYTFTIQTSGGTKTVDVPPKRSVHVYCDGTDIFKVTNGYDKEIGSEAYGATITVDMDDTYDYCDVTLTGNPTINFSGGYDGKEVRLRLRQDGTGSRTVTWGTMVRFDAGGAPTLSTTASKLDYLTFVYNASDAKYDCISTSIGH